jgi:hypothetical protein
MNQEEKCHAPPVYQAPKKPRARDTYITAMDQELEAVNARIKELEASLDAELSRREELLSLKSAVNGQQRVNAYQ